MKQVHELAAAPALTDTFSWPDKIRPTTVSFAVLRQKIAELRSCRQHLLKTAAATVFISALFLAGSYIFFAQLAKYGW